MTKLKKAVGRVIIDAGQKKRLVSCAEGTIINLNASSDDIIDKMYAILSSTINKQRTDEVIKTKKQSFSTIIPIYNRLSTQIWCPRFKY